MSYLIYLTCLLRLPSYPCQADMASSPEHIARVRQALPYDPAVPVSAATERWLCNQRRAGKVSYHDTAGDVTATTGGWVAGAGQGGRHRQ